jgi:hypothetical protein
MAGKIVHFELPASDVDRAVGFWNGLFSWKIGESMSDQFDYRMFQNAEGQGGAVMASESGGGHMVVYFDTDDIEASIARVRELGGTAGDKQPVPTHGWFAACKDTEGTEFSLWQNDPTAA